MALFARLSPPAEAREIDRLLGLLPDDPGVDPDVRLRLQIVHQSQMRSKVPAIAQNLDVHRQTVVRWILRFNHDGLPALCNPHSAPLPLYVRPLTPKEYSILSQDSSEISVGTERALYARVILYSHQRERIGDIANMLGVCSDCLRRWIKAFNHMGLLVFSEMDGVYPPCVCLTQHLEQTPAIA